MKTQFLAEEKYAAILRQCADDYEYRSAVKPERFAEIMKTNIGSIGAANGGRLDPDGLELRNPIVAVIGDSVTAGHFESLMPEDPEEMQKVFAEVMELMKAGKPLPPGEVTDARVCYPEQFRAMLIDKYELTSVSILNAGIAGDNLKSMSHRLERDVIRHQPDLVIINGALNWDEQMGSTADWKAILAEMVDRVKAGTDADIVLLTPNGDIVKEVPMLGRMGSEKTCERVEAIRQVAAEKEVCLVDVYSIWEAAREKGCPWEKILANGVNHPDKNGHWVYARALMKMLETV